MNSQELFRQKLTYGAFQPLFCGVTTVYLLLPKSGVSWNPYPTCPEPVTLQICQCLCHTVLNITPHCSLSQIINLQNKCHFLV